MINNLLKFNITKNFSLDIYNNSYFNIFNEYNKISCNDKHKLQELYSNNKCFEVPFLENTLAWGKEKVYYPFTSTLVKIVETYKEYKKNVAEEKDILDLIAHEKDEELLELAKSDLSSCKDTPFP